MKTFVIAFFALISVLSCRNTSQNNTVENSTSIAIAGRDTLIDFESEIPGKLPTGFVANATHKAKKIQWNVIDDNGNKVVEQQAENSSRCFNLLILDSLAYKDISASVKIKANSGKIDQGGGLVWRYRDKNNYYVVRANPLEDNVVLYKVENGNRTDLPLVGKGRTYGIDVPPLGNGWNTLKLVVKSDLFTVSLNNKELFKVEDKTFTDGGKIGFWTKADAITYFDDLKISTE